MSSSMLPESYSIKSPVLITGGTGYVAGWIIKRLLEEGIIVHVAVRDPSNEKKVAHLKELESKNPGQLKFFKAELLEEDSYTEAMQGCTLVFHTASPFTSKITDPQKDLVDPALLGTRNVLQSVNKTPTVTRVVLTSSIVAIYGDNKDIKSAPNHTLTEDQWNTTSSVDHQPYPYSKVVAEKEAWKIHDAQTRWDLVTVNPTLVFGPSLTPTTSESFAIMKQFGDGTMKSGCPKLGLGVVDVRDVAEAHIRAAFTSTAKGRYLVNGSNTTLFEIGNELRPEYNAYPLPKFEVPKALIWLVGPIVLKGFTRKFISQNVGFPFKADNSKSVRELKLEYKPLRETVQEFFQELIDSKQVKAR
ncbi:CIC11C00000001437 [Sungouiella intermedia]|uniref:CIC11C00000001437 n=1 Tax=Sungouiella intermedia TaxID=45354 RepID=A0A1L0E009_9ASCO|nr:CIC11C00000001437 [[Candida] intermedia]